MAILRATSAAAVAAGDVRRVGFSSDLRPVKPTPGVRELNEINSVLFVLKIG